MTLFNIDLPGIINSAMGSLVLDATITPSTRTPDGQGGQTLNYGTPVAAKGFVDTYSDFARLSGVPATDRKIIILAASTTAVPKQGDRVTIEGRTYDIIAVNKDPASATYELQAR
jgi:hypothetical protein